MTAQSICLYDDMSTDLVNIRALLVGWGKMAVPAGKFFSMSILNQ